MIPFDYQARTRIVFGPGSLAQLGLLAREQGFARTLLVADPGVLSVGHVATVRALLETAGVEVHTFHDFDANPDSAMVERGRAHAAPLAVDSIVGLGGGSSLDCAKGINFLLTNGGTIADYRGYGKAATPLLPAICVPTTAGTGSEAQSYAVIADAATHMKMACGDASAAPAAAILDPTLTVSAPRAVTAMAGYDALAHAVETAVTGKRTPLSDAYSHAAWRLIAGAFDRVLETPGDLEARSAMAIGAHFAGIAIEQSMLGAAHACANPLTARYGIAHGQALALLLPHVVRWNGLHVADRYAGLLAAVGLPFRSDPADRLAHRLAELAAAAGLAGSLRDHGVAADDLPELAELAAEQWTGGFNPRPFDANAAYDLYQHAF